MIGQKTCPVWGDEHYNPTMRGMFYITATTVEHLPLFNEDKNAREVMHAILYVHRVSRTRVHAFVAMTNHMHILKVLIKSNTPPGPR